MRVTDDMLCVASLIVFSILGVFSATYREKARRAFECVMSGGATNACESDLTDDIQASLVSKALSISPRLARVVNKYLVVFAWVFVLLVVASTVLVGVSLYNYVAYGHCDGPQGTGVCAYDAVSDAANESLSNQGVGRVRRPDTYGL